jgi:hypothetical protein
MQFPSSLVTINRITLAVILVDADSTYPAPGAAILAQAQHYFPTLPILLISPRVGGFSRSFAHFDLTNIIKHINADRIDWQPTPRPTTETAAPF